MLRGLAATVSNARHLYGGAQRSSTIVPLTSGAWILAIVLIGFLQPRLASAQTVLDEFEDVSTWSGTASDGARIEIARDTGSTGMGMRIDYDLGASGYVIARKAFPLSLPANYAFKFAVRGEAAPNNFELKLVDRSGRNVWWYNQRRFSFTTEWHQVTVKKDRFEFAWGPGGGGPPKQIAYIEFAITAGTGGRGSVWIDELRLEEREPPGRSESPPAVSASTFLPGHEAKLILDQDPQTSWKSGTLAANQWVLVDFLKTREYGGLVIDWGSEDYATAYQVQVSDDGEKWTSVYHSTVSKTGRDYIYLPDGESRFIRLDLEQSSRGQGYEIRTLLIEPFEFSASLNQFFAAIARDAPPGTYPKYLSGKQTYWTVIGVNGDSKEGLMNEEGAIEVDRGAFSIEPFLFADGSLITWNAAQTSTDLANGYLPIPSVHWQHDGLALTVTAFAAGKPGASQLYARYGIQNSRAESRTVDLFLAIRPFQVLPPWQSLNMAGGVTPIREIGVDGRTVLINEQKLVVSLTPPDGFGAATFAEGSVTDFLLRDKVPSRSQVSDPFGYASAAFQYHLDLAPGAHTNVDIVIPFHKANGAASSQFEPQFEAIARSWEQVLGRVDFQLPPVAGRIARTLKSTLAYILINRDGPALHPGARNYARSWIRDGAMTSAALLEMGCPGEVRDFIRWFAQYQFADGKIPCCVDQRGADRIPENDSNGEFLYTVAEYYRYTHDVGFLNDMWPAMIRAVDFIAMLRQQRMTEAYQRPDKRAFYGLLPESISHEGYSGHPVHSYWDDFFALRGLKDAASMAIVVGDDEHAARFAALRDAFRTDLYASIARTMADHKLDYVPASVELGDFDPTSTAIALAPGDELPYLPQPALTHTFDKYFAHVQERQHASGPGDDAYTPYELRNVGALVRLGQRERAVELLDLMLDGQRPPAWNQWAELVWRDPNAPKFIGDMPHTWVGSSFIQSARALFAYEREADHALVLAAGLPSAWVMSDTGVAVHRLPTYEGTLNYSLHSEGSNALRLKLSGDLHLPPGNIVLQPPLPGPLKAVTVNGTPLQGFGADSATISEFPADVLLEYQLQPEKQ